VAARTTTTGGAAGRGVASRTARPIAATLANAVRLRQNERRCQAPATTLLRRSSRSEIRRQTSPEGCTGSIATVSGMSRSCHAWVASRRPACAGSNASKRRRAAPRIVPIT
jgi:hypothetical protein